jgi:hypothetical protein
MEMIMSVKLQFAPMPGRSRSPLENRKENIIRKLSEQAQLAADASAVRTKQRWVKNPDGTKSRRESTERIRPWWREESSTNRAFMPIKVGQVSLVLDSKSGATAAVCKRPDLPATIEALRESVASGQYDGAISAVPVRAFKRKQAPAKKKVAA